SQAGRARHDTCTRRLCQGPVVRRRGGLAMGPRLELAVDPAEAGPDLSGSFSVAGIEVTQAIQDLDHSVPLIAGKPTVVRVYLNRPDPAVITVRAEIETTGSGGTASVPSLDTLDLDPDRNGDLPASRTD